MPRAEKKSHWIFLHFPFDFAQSQVSTFGLDSSLYKKSNTGRTTKTRHAGKQEVTPPKRGSSLPNYLDQKT
jgi:hypothetical protein